MGGRVQAWTTAAHQGWTQRTISMLLLTVLYKTQEFSDFHHWESPVLLRGREGRWCHTELLCLRSWVVVGTQLNISGEDADLHGSDEHIPGALRNVLSSPPPTSKNKHGDDSQRGFLCYWSGPGWPFSHDQLCLQQSGARQPRSQALSSRIT